MDLVGSAKLADEPVAGGGENVGQEINREKGNGGSGGRCAPIPYIQKREAGNL